MPDKQGPFALLRTRDFLSALILTTLPVIVFVLQQNDLIDFTAGVYPREWKGLPGIIFMPLFHGSSRHLLSNLPPLFLLSWSIFHLLPRQAWKVLLLILLIGNLLVFAFARPSWHIGASGLIYGMVAFLFMRGILGKDRPALAMSLLVVFVYGSLVWGVLPADPGVSWEGHLFSALTGLALGWYFRVKNPPSKYPWMDEEDDEDDIPYYPGVNQPFR